jgi:hypothetical protein
MGGEGIFRHELLGDLPRKVPIDTALDVDIGKLIELKSGILAQLLAFAREVRLFAVGLRTDGDIFAGGHRHGAGHQSRDTRDQDIVPRRGCCGNADDQACSREDAVVGPEHCCSKPSDAVDEVPLRDRRKTAHPTFRRSDQIRPIRTRTRRTIRMMPITPMPP